jgi:hypothetical protein
MFSLLFSRTNQTRRCTNRRRMTKHFGFQPPFIGLSSRIEKLNHRWAPPASAIILVLSVFAVFPASATTLTLHGLDFAEEMTPGVNSQVNVSQDIFVSEPHVLNGGVNPDPHAPVIFVWIGYPHGDSKGLERRSVLNAEGDVFSDASITEQIHNIDPLFRQHFFIALNDTGVSTSGIPTDGSPIAVGVASDAFEDGGAIRVTMNGNIDGGTAVIDGAVIRIFHSRDGRETDVGELFGGPPDFPYRKALDINVSGSGRYELTVPFSLSGSLSVLTVPEPTSSLVCLSSAMGFSAAMRQRRFVRSRFPTLKLYGGHDVHKRRRQ